MASISDDDARLVFVAESVAAQPIPGIIECIIDRWWIVHPTKGLVYHQHRGYGARISPTPQCNRDKSIAERLASGLYPWAEVRQIPVVFHRINVSDYV